MSGESSPHVIQHFVLLCGSASCEYTWQMEDVDHMVAQCWDGVDLLLVPADVGVCSVIYTIVLLIPHVILGTVDRNMKCRHCLKNIYKNNPISKTLTVINLSC